MGKIQIPVKEFNDNLYPHQLEVLEHFDSEPEVRNRVVVFHRRARKTTLALNLLIRETARSKEKVFNYVAPTFRQAKSIIWRDPMMLKKYLPREILKKDFNESELIGEFNSGSLLNVGGADNPDRWRGTGGYGWVLDEFAVQRNGKMLFEEIIYPIVKENGGWVMFLMTPKGRNHGWEYYKKAQDNPKWASWFLPVTKSGVLSEEQIEEARQEMPEHLFAQEFLCEFLEGGGGVIKRVDEAVAGKLLPAAKGQRYVMGVDLGKKQDWTVLSVLNCETRHLDAFERFQKIDWGFQKEKIARMAKMYNNALVVLDSTGLGDVVEDDLKRMDLSIRGYQFTQRSKRQLIEKLILAVEDRRITYPDIEVMTDELKDFDIDERGRYSAPEGLHDDCCISLALAIEALGAEVYGGQKETDTYVPYEEKFAVGV